MVQKFDDNIILYLSFTVLKMCWWGGGNTYQDEDKSPL